MFSIVTVRTAQETTCPVIILVLRVFIAVKAFLPRRCLERIRDYTYGKRLMGRIYECLR
jgi:hypothetical protein